MKNERFHLYIFLFAVCIYFLTAYNSHGFYHADEHYQIIEFAGLKLGTHTPNELAWEYNAQIRPALQPTICIVVFKMLSLVHINNPYSQVFILRLLTAILSLLIIRYFIVNTENQVVGNRSTKIYYLLSYFLWFIPFISVRFSSETWSGLFFLLSLAIFFSRLNSEYKPYLLGLISGFSFIFRFQIAFAIIGFFLWLIIIERKKLDYFLKFGIAFLSVLILGFFIDFWFYGEPVFTTWNYFHSVIDSGGNGFGTSPWYFYFIKLLSLPSYFVGIPLVFALVLLIIYTPKNIYLWSIIPFILVHTLVPHKEERFIFPIVFLFPIILVSGYNQFVLIIRSRYMIRALNYFMALIFLAVNLIGIVAMSQKAAGNGRMEISKYIHDNYGTKLIKLIYCSWANPYNPWNSIPIKFYAEKKMDSKLINNLCEINDSLIDTGAQNFLIVRKIDLRNQECSQLIYQHNFVFVKQSIPKWIEFINKYYKGFDEGDVLVLYKYIGKN
ncbi:MAG: hypothetical protein WCX31_01195 [Salinivirgaceae bacterium]